jgi:hypothetical protein
MGGKWKDKRERRGEGGKIKGVLSELADIP